MDTDNEMLIRLTKAELMVLKKTLDYGFNYIGRSDDMHDYEKARQKISSAAQICKGQ